MINTEINIQLIKKLALCSKNREYKCDADHQCPTQLHFPKVKIPHNFKWYFLGNSLLNNSDDLEKESDQPVTLAKKMLESFCCYCIN